MSDVIQIRKAVRQGARLVIGIAGISGSGKTRTAIELAYGLARRDASKVGFIDTENQRGSLYADVLQEAYGDSTPFNIADLEPPFSPDRYIAAIKQFQAAGVEALVIDTVSHEWSGLGGCLDIVDAAKASILGWKIAKPAHKRFVNTLLQSNMHIIVCVRMTAKTDWKDPKNPKSLGMMPVQQDEFMYEMTASMVLHNQGKEREVLKTSGTDAIFGGAGFQTGYLGAEHGEKLRAWVDGASRQLDAALEQTRNTLRTESASGMEAYRKAWDAAPAKHKKALVADGSHDTFKRAAEDFDRQAASVQAGGEELAELNDAVLGAQQ